MNTKRLLILLFLFSGFAFGQNYKNIVSVADATTAFGVNISEGTKVYDADADLYYYCITASLADSTLTISHDNFIRQANFTDLDTTLWALNGTEAYLKTGLTNVGIGTANPDEKLEVVSGNILLGVSQYLKWRDFGGTKRNILQLDDSDNFNIKAVGTADIKFYDGNDNLMVIFEDKGTNAYLGIGTATPSEMLHVEGNVYAYTVKATHYGGHSDFTFGDDGNIVEVLADTMIHDNIKITGRLGVGTRAAPRYTLHVDGEVKVDGGMVNLDVGSGFGFGTLGLDALIKCESSPKDLTFTTGAGEIMRIEAGGDVGIGTSNPTSKLHVIGSQYTSVDIGLGGNIKLAADKSITFASTDAAIKHEDSSGDLLIQTVSNTRIRIEDGGNVGIGLGTVAPSCNLQVKGAIASGSVTIAASSDNTSVASANVVYIDATDGAVTIGGFTGGITNQVIHLVVTNHTNSITLESGEDTGNQDIMLKNNKDQTIQSYGGWILIYDGSNWVECKGESTEYGLSRSISDHSASGMTIPAVAAVNMAIGDACYIKSDGEMALADADAIATASAIFIVADATIAADATGNFLFQGVVRDDTWNWTVGGLIYLSVTGTTGNTLTQTAPTGTDDVVQILGVALSADMILFTPNLMQIELN